MKRCGPCAVMMTGQQLLIERWQTLNKGMGQAAECYLRFLISVRMYC